MNNSVYINETKQLSTISTKPKLNIFYVLAPKDKDEGNICKEILKEIVHLKSQLTNKYIGFFVNSKEDILFETPSVRIDFENTINEWNPQNLSAGVQGGVASALKSCIQHNVFNDDKIQGWINILFIIGSEESDIESCKILTDKLKEEGVKIVVIGKDQELKNLSSFNSNFDSENRIKLKEYFQDFLGVYDEYDCKLKFSFNRVTSIKESVYIILEINNTSNRILNDIRIEFDENPYFERIVKSIGKIGKGETINVDITLEVKQGSDEKELAFSSIINYSIYENKSHIPLKTEFKAFQLLPQMFMKDFLSFKSDLNFLDEMRLALFGPVGSGKSSLINLLFHLFSMIKELTPAPAAKTKGTNTKEINRYRIDKFLNNKLSLPISIKDVWGKEMRLYQNFESIKFDREILKNIIIGKYGDGFSLLNNNNSKKLKKNPKELVDIAIFLLRCDNLHGEAFEVIKSYCHSLTEYGREYIILITYTDTLTPNQNNFKMMFDPNFDARKGCLEVLTEGKEALDSKKIFFITNKLIWEENEEENIFTSQLSTLLVFRYLFTNYTRFMKTLMSRDEYFKENRFTISNVINSSNSNNRKRKLFFKKDGNDEDIVAIEIIGDEKNNNLDEVENKIRNKLDIDENKKIIFFNENKNEEIKRLSILYISEIGLTNENPILIIED